MTRHSENRQYLDRVYAIIVKMLRKNLEKRSKSGTVQRFSVYLLKEDEMKHSQENWDGDWLDEMYNNRARVLESEAYLQDWQQRSKAFRTELTAENRAHLNISYGAKPAETLDIFQPEAPESGETVPVLVYIHGGWWSALDKDDHSFVASEWVKRGICVVVVNYTLCPYATVPQITEEAARAVAWIQKNIQNYGADKNKVTLSGHSAGGHLTAMMQTVNWQKLGLSAHCLPFRNAVSISGLFDLRPMLQAPFLSVLALTEEQVVIASPVRFQPNHGSCLSAVVGAQESEEHIRQNKLIQEVWGKEAVPLCEAITGTDHFTVVDSLTQTDSRLFQIVAALLK